MHLCRICYEPCCSKQKCKYNCCKCRGTVAHAHKQCLEKWVRVSGNTYCKLCNTPFLGIQMCDDPTKLRLYEDVYDNISPVTFTFAVIVAVLIRGVYNGAYLT